jgi:hypothetical protein
MDVRQRQRPSAAQGLPLSLGMHALIGLLLLFFLQPPKQEGPIAEPVVDVELVAPSGAAGVPDRKTSARTAPNSDALPLPRYPLPEPRERAAPSERQPPQAPPSAASPEATPPVAAPGRIKAATLLSAKTLSDPRSWQARSALQQLSGTDRLEQICNLEAMEQLHAWDSSFLADAVVAYATAETRLTGRTTDAPGVAIRSRGHWYAIGYTCTMSANAEEVTAFEFQMGTEIPQEQWSEHSLYAGTSVD